MSNILINQLREEILQKVEDYYNLKFKDQYTEENEISRVNYAGRVFDAQEIKNIVESGLDFWLTAGRFHEEFTWKLQDFYDVSDIILTNSGSSANLLAISALTSPKLKDKRLKAGDEVITVAAGFPSTLAPIIQNNLVPVFIDVEIGTYNIIAEKIKEALSPKTKAIFIAHTLGNPFNLDAVTDIVKKHNLWLIEDNCDALGSRYNGQLTGTFGHIATGSFYPAHHITTGEGGCVITNDEDLGRIIKSFRDWGRDCYCEGGENNTCGRRFTQKFGNLPLGYDHKYVYTHIGYNLKMTEMQAAIGSAQMEKLNNFTEKRISNFSKIYNGLKYYQDNLILPRATENSIPSWFCFIISIRPDTKITRNKLVEYLNQNGIETRNLFAGNLIKHPAFMNSQYRTIDDLSNTDYIMNNTFFIGLYPGISDNHINYMLKTFNKFFSENKL